jgi:hypothetical protein
MATEPVELVHLGYEGKPTNLMLPVVHDVYEQLDQIEQQLAAVSHNAQDLLYLYDEKHYKEGSVSADVRNFLANIVQQLPTELDREHVAHSTYAICHRHSFRSHLRVHSVSPSRKFSQNRNGQ